ncbi:MAG: TRAP transporter small permease [Paracoccus sp. (in: a-proteobacteria)]|nr:TRAP transporter small permease [Paracoccus sp. (in: a-proteobacteria)]
MFLRFLDRFEEVFISILMAAAVVLIFVAVTHRFAIGWTASSVRYFRANDMPEMMAYARSFYSLLASIKLTWAQELCIYLFVWMAKFGAAYGVRLGIHVGVDILVERLSPELRRPVTIFAFLGCILFTFIVAWIGFDFVWHVGKAGAISPDLEVKMWIIYLAVPLGSSLMCFRFLQALHMYWTTGELAHHDHGHVDGLDDEADDLTKGAHG